MQLKFGLRFLVGGPRQGNELSYGTKKKLDEHFYKHVVKPKRDPVGIRTQDPQLRRLLLYPAELRNHHICECKDSESIRENANMRKK